MKKVTLFVLAGFMALFVACGDKEKKDENAPATEVEKVSLPECDSQEVKGLLASALAEQASKDFDAVASEAAEGIDVEAIRATVSDEAKVEKLSNFITIEAQKIVKCGASNEVLGGITYNVTLDDANTLGLDIVSSEFQEKIKGLLTNKE
ncbi:hypothetical protein ACWIWK_08810 [Helicobacter sp. 23-1048]